MEITPPFKPAWWLNNPHLQTVWATVAGRNIQLQLRRERLELPDGDFIDVEWSGENNQPIAVILHGLGGSIDSPYAKGMIHALNQHGWRTVFMHFRGCSGEPNRLERGYHSADIGDLHFLLETLAKRAPHVPRVAVGFSLGGNVLLKWLAANENSPLLRAAGLVSVPFELNKAACRMLRGFSRAYQWWILRILRRNLRMKFKNGKAPINVEQALRLKTFWEFDDMVTAPLHGFISVHDYYDKASTRTSLRLVKIPTLVIHALDDPFMTMDITPRLDELSLAVTLEVYQNGGHVGFISGSVPGRPEYWLEKRIPNFFRKFRSF